MTRHNTSNPRAPLLPRLKSRGLLARERSLIPALVAVQVHFRPYLCVSYAGRFIAPPSPVCAFFLPPCGVITHEMAYYISSLPNQAARLLDATRHHWAIENGDY